MTSDVAMGNGEQPAASGSSDKSEAASTRHREETEEEEECAPKNNQAKGDKATSTTPPSMKGHGSTAGASKSSQYSASVYRDSAPVTPSAKEPPSNVDLEESDEDGQEDQPGQMIYVDMVVDTYYEGNAATFAYNGLQVSFVLLFNQTKGFTLYPRAGVNLPLCHFNGRHPPPGIQGLK